MKNIFFVFALISFFSITSISAQKNNFAIGVKGGLSTAALQGHELQVSGEGVDNLIGKLKDANYGVQAGVFVRVPMGSRLFLQPELTLNSNKANFQFNDENNGAETIIEQRYNYLDFPVLLGLSLGALKLQAGPVGHFYFENSKEILNREGWSAAMDEFNLGYALGGALDIGAFTVDLRYAGNFSKFGQTIEIGDQSYAVDEAAKNWVATVGFRF